MSGAVRVEGLREMQRAFAVAGKSASRELRDALKDAGEPVRASAQSLAGSAIGTGRTVDWSRMRVGVTRTLVYVAPVQRGVKSRTDRSRRRPNLKTVLLDRAMNPAFDRNREVVRSRTAQVLEQVGKQWERA